MIDEIFRPGKRFVTPKATSLVDNVLENLVSIGIRTSDMLME